MLRRAERARDAEVGELDLTLAADEGVRWRDVAVHHHVAAVTAAAVREIERGRELQSGMAAEETLQLPPRDTRNIEKAEKKEADDIDRGRAIIVTKTRGSRVVVRELTS